jgi:hypothetical protein
MVERIKIASIPRCGYGVGGDLNEMANYSKRELCLLAAETRLALQSSKAHVSSSRTEVEIVDLD